MRPFDFLGFTHYWCIGRNGSWVLKRKTAKDRLRRSLTAVNRWCCTHRHGGSAGGVMSIMHRGAASDVGVEAARALCLLRDSGERLEPDNVWLPRRAHLAKVAQPSVAWFERVVKPRRSSMPCPASAKFLTLPWSTRSPQGTHRNEGEDDRRRSLPLHPVLHPRAVSSSADDAAVHFATVEVAGVCSEAMPSSATRSQGPHLLGRLSPGCGRTRTSGSVGGQGQQRPWSTRPRDA